MSPIKEPTWGNVLDMVPMSTISYVVAHKGLFQRAPVPEIDEAEDLPDLWRAVLDRALLDYIRGPGEVGQKAFTEVSVWLHDKDETQDFGTVCAFAILDEDTVFHVFKQCRYQGDAHG